MRKVMGCAAAILAALLPLARAQDAREILKKTAESYQNLTSYDFEILETGGAGGGAERIERIAGAGIKTRAEGLGPALIVSNGESNWQYDPTANEYTKKPGWLSSRLGEYKNIALGVKNARIVRQEEVRVSGGAIACWVIEVERSPGPAPETLWIDKARYLVLKMTGRTGNAEVSRTFTKASVGQPMADGLFEFTPPPGALQVPKLTGIARPMMLGKAMPDFTLEDGEGGTITRSSLANLVSVVAFVDVLAIPGRSEPLPYLESLYRSYRNRGLTVLVVVTGAVGDPAAMLRQGGYDFPAAKDADGALSKKLGIAGRSTGVLVVDRAGTILYQRNDWNAAAKDEAASALRRAGIF